MSPANRRSADPSVIAAIHHPLRRRLIDLLGVDGPSTASRLAEATGELVGNVSHHLKVLAAAGVIEQAPELARTRRERWWRPVPARARRRIAAGADDLVAETAEEADLTHRTTKVRQWFGLRSEYGEPWTDAAISTERWLSLTPERLAELDARLDAVVQEYADSPSEGEDARPVFLFAHAVPARP